MYLTSTRRCANKGREGTVIMATQDQALRTNSIIKRIITDKQNVLAMCSGGGGKERFNFNDTATVATATTTTTTTITTATTSINNNNNSF